MESTFIPLPTVFYMKVTEKVKKTINRQPPGKKRQDSLGGGIPYHSMFQLILYIVPFFEYSLANPCHKTGQRESS